MSLKNSSDTLGNRTRDLPVFSVVPQPQRHRAPPGIKYYICNIVAREMYDIKFAVLGLCYVMNFYTRIEIV
jgi:hypothetical protein